MALKHQGWWDKYVDLPFREKGRNWNGVDCWGLIYLVYKTELGIILPCYSDQYINTADNEQIQAIIRREKMKDWPPVEKGKEKPFDGICMRKAKTETHVGIIVMKGEMLHITEGAMSTIEPIKTSIWRRRIIGIFRHKAAAAALSKIATKERF